MSTLAYNSLAELDNPADGQPRVSEPGELVLQKAYSRLKELEGEFFGSLFVTNFRVIFEYDRPTNSDRRLLVENLSIPLCTIFRLEKSSTKRGKLLLIRCKDFRDIQFIFSSDSLHIDKVEDTITKFAFPTKPTLLFAFFNTVKFPDAPNGWHIYNQFKEFARLGLPDDKWRFTDINRNYDAIKTYPAMFGQAIVG